MKISQEFKELSLGFCAIVAGAIFIVLGIVFLMETFGPTEEQKQIQIISEIDGCKVYRFYDGNYHYVTRCGDKVTTQKNWNESCGKACTRRKTEELVTEENQ